MPRFDQWRDRHRQRRPPHRHPGFLSQVQPGKRAPCIKGADQAAPPTKVLSAQAGRRIPRNAISISLAHVFTPGNNALVDTLESKVFYQQTRVGDDTVSAQDIVTIQVVVDRNGDGEPAGECFDLLP